MNLNREYEMFAKGAKLDAKIVQQINEWLEQRRLLGWVFTNGDFFPDTKNAHWQSYDLAWWEAEGKQRGYERDMADLSEAFPDITFCLCAHGEERDDIWDGYWLNGDCEMCYGMIPWPQRIEW